MKYFKRRPKQVTFYENHYIGSYMGHGISSIYVVLTKILNLMKHDLTVQPRFVCTYQVKLNHPILTRRCCQLWLLLKYRISIEKIYDKLLFIGD